MVELILYIPTPVIKVRTNVLPISPANELHGLAPTLNALVDQMKRSEEKITVKSQELALGAVASWLMEGLAIFQLQSVML